MEFETASRYSQNPAMSYTPHYYYNDRNMPLTASSSGMRPNPRGYPVGGPVGGPRLRTNIGRDDGMENGLARRRIAVACARCRKRKIRCSGDPGDGTGCKSCKDAGVEASVCQFNRVGSSEATRVLEGISIANQHAMMPVYNNGVPLYSRTSYPQLDTKWTVPYQTGEETSPVETYNLDQPNAYLPNPNTMLASVYGSYRWTQSTHEPGSVYSSQSVPYIQTNVRDTTTSEALSPLNMTSLQSSLPSGAHSRLMDPLPQRQLPIPQPSPAQTTRNIVDQIQDQRLRSTHAATSVSAGESTVGYLPTIVNDPGTSSAGPPLNFGTTSLLTAVPAAIPTTYSNFRNYNLPTSSSTEALSTMARQNSQANLYSFSPDNSSKRHSAGDASSNDNALVSGHRYMPLSQTESQPHHQDSLESLRRDSYNNRTVPVHRASTSNLNRSY
ncbi:hypothetical protein CC80DRAFT_94326 [Byssothecium circinans]|uniref:Zn(2)-C6 fungal-type domain-containing protein n=1 Tax=Byssothecium circinans TaxID=147558 RepID=A0A6A5TTR9_9PLEO|nr:hypothetical protein CC80DRAFT_94326 [Byssothecium circinans]